MKSKIRNFIVPVLWLIILIMNVNNFFFWDTIQLASKQASWFYDSNFSSFFLPADINSGHPPFFGMLLALLWMIFGKSLIVGHILMMLITLGSIYQSNKLGEKWVGNNWSFLFPLVLFCNPYFLGHSILVSPDNLLIFLFIWAINTREHNNKIGFSIATLFLAMISMRGIMVVGSLFIAEIALQIINSRKIQWKELAKFIPAFAFGLIFFGTHLIKNKWIGFHEGSPWEESFDLVNLKGYIYNLGLISWRILDFGNLFVVIPAILLAWKQKLSFKKAEFQWIILLLLGLILLFVIPLSAFKYLTNHRYFMPIILLISFLFIKLIIEANWQKWLIIPLLLLFLGNWWIYPRNISQGWDVSLGHLPFYSLVENMHQKIKVRGIESDQIGTQFPLKSQAKDLYLKDPKNTFKEVDLDKDQYVLYSRIMNDFKEKEKKYLDEHFSVLERLQRGKIDLILYERN